MECDGWGTAPPAAALWGNTCGLATHGVWLPTTHNPSSVPVIPVNPSECPGLPCSLCPVGLVSARPVLCWKEPPLCCREEIIWRQVNQLESENFMMNTFTMQKKPGLGKYIIYSTLCLCKNLEKMCLILAFGRLCCFSVGYVVLPMNLGFLNPLLLHTGIH